MTLCVDRCPNSTSDVVACSKNKNLTTCPRDCTKVTTDTSATFDFTSTSSMSTYISTLTSSAMNPKNWICLYQSEALFARACYPSYVLTILN